MQFNFQGKVALITGASRGIGRAITKLFAESGCTVVVHYNTNDTMAQKTIEELPGKGHTLHKADIANPQEIENMVQAIIQNYGTIDIVVNNAGIYEEVPLTELSYAQWQDKWQRTIDINLMGAANLCYCVAQEMRKKKSGKIINITSRGAFRGEPEACYYGASKAGLNSLSQSLAQALAPYSISVYAVAPGFVNTDMVTHIMESKHGEAIKAQSPLNRIAEPQEVANTVAFLASEETEFLTGSIIDINGASYLRS